MHGEGLEVMSEGVQSYQKYNLFALEILYLQSALSQCVAQEKKLAVTFYKNLFDEHPSTKQLFHNDRRKQQVMFSTLIEAAAAEMMNPNTLEPLLRSVGDHHRKYKVTRQQIEMGRSPFFKAVKSCIGDKDFDKHAPIWENLYSMLIDLMMGEAASSLSP